MTQESPRHRKPEEETEQPQPAPGGRGRPRPNAGDKISRGRQGIKADMPANIGEMRSLGQSRATQKRKRLHPHLYK